MRDSDFFTLKRIYKEMILPRLIKYSKSTSLCQNELRKLAKFYVEGFISWIPFTKEDLSYFFHGFNLVKRTDMEFWIRLACVCTLSDKTL
jgi:hypothetical protein